MNGVSYLNNLLNGIDVEWRQLWEVTIWDKKFNAVEKFKQPKIKKYHYFLAKEFEPLVSDNGDVKLLTTNISELYTTEEKAGDKISTGEIVALPWGGNPIVQYYNGKFLTSDNRIATSANTEFLSTKYLYYFLLSNLGLIASFYRGSGIKHPSMAAILDMKIPIPSMQIQAEIVRILDAFTAHTAELTAELTARKKQYSHYQFEMLQFTERTQYLKIGECCDIQKGLTPIKKAAPGKYPLVATTEERQSSSEYQFDCAAVCVPLISSRGHGVASIDRIYFQDGKFALGNILCAIIPHDSRVLSAKFLRYYLFDKKDVLLVPLMRGGANVSLTVDSLKKVKIPIPPIADQLRIVRILDKFDELVKGLPREIELRQKQYEYYRDLLLSFPKPDEQVA